MPALQRMVFALFAVSAGTNVPTPLLIVYRDRLDLSPDVLTAVFGVYAAGLVPALFIAGPLSDRLGRRPVVVPFVVLSGLASLVYLLASESLVLLFVARFLQGVVSGVVFSVGSAWVAELSRAAGTASAGGRRAAQAMSGGFSLGPLVAGVLGEYAPGPLVLSYVLHAVLVGVGLLALRGVPETAVLVAQPEGRRPRVPLVRAEDRGTLWTVLLPAAVLVYAFPSVAINAVPLLVEDPGRLVLLTGILAGLTLGAGTLAAPLQARLGRWTTVVGAFLGAGGYAVAAVSSGTLGTLAVSVPGLVGGSLLLGVGHGLTLAGGMALTQRLALPERRGALSAAFLAAAYIGFAMPFVTSVAAGGRGVGVPLLVEAAVVALLGLRLTVAARQHRT